MFMKEIYPAFRRDLMIRRCASILVCSLLLGMILAGCQKAADQPGGPDANANSSPSAAESAKSAVKRALEPKPLVVPTDTVIAVVLDQTINSKTNQSGDKFSATV